MCVGAGRMRRCCTLSNHGSKSLFRIGSSKARVHLNNNINIMLTAGELTREDMAMTTMTAASAAGAGAAAAGGGATKGMLYGLLFLKK